MDVRPDFLRARLDRSPYYREKLLGSGLTTRDLDCLDSISDFPFTTRDELAQHASEILAFTDQTDYDTTHRISSTGTSGARLQVFRGMGDELRTLKLWESVCGGELPENLRVLFVCTLPEPKEYEVKKFIGSRELTIRRIGVESLERLDSIAFDVITGTPFGILSALESDTLAQTKRQARLAYSTALPLSLRLSHRIAAELTCPHLHCYSMTETGPIAWWCERCNGAYHTYADMFVEAVSGRLCLTKLSDSVFPLLRYLTDDRAEVHRGTAACGFEGTTLLNLIGRKDQALCSSDCVASL